MGSPFFFVFFISRETSQLAAACPQLHAVRCVLSGFTLHSRLRVSFAFFSY